MIGRELVEAGLRNPTSSCAQAVVTQSGLDSVSAQQSKLDVVVLRLKVDATLLRHFRILPVAGKTSDLW